MIELLLLFYEFAKIGLFAIGGGLVTLPFLYELANKYEWFTTTQLAYFIAISESTPGPIGINMATFAGFSAYGSLGSIVATLAIIFPSLIIVTIVAKFLTAFALNTIIKDIFSVVKPIVTGLIFVALLGLLQITVFNDEFQFQILNAVIFLTVFFLIFKFQRHPIFYIFLSAIIGIVLKITI